MPFHTTEIEEADTTHPLVGRFRFSIADNGGMGYVLCTLTYNNRADAETARRAAGDMLVKAVSATK